MLFAAFVAAWGERCVLLPLLITPQFTRWCAAPQFAAALTSVSGAFCACKGDAAMKLRAKKFRISRALACV